MMLRVAVLVGGLMSMRAGTLAAQDRAWVAEVAIGRAGFVDEATKSYLVGGGGVRRYMTPRVSIGAEVVTMSNPELLRDRNLMITGNIVYDVRGLRGQRRLTPFLVAGVGSFWGRDIVRGGPYWSSDPAFTAGAGLRARVTDAVFVAAEYRVGWELHQRVGGTLGYMW